MRTVSLLAFAVAIGPFLLSPPRTTAQQSPAVTVHQSPPFTVQQSSSGTVQQPSTTVLIQPPIARNCPVGLSAHHANQGGMVKVSPGEKQPEQGYSITFMPGISHSIVQARITLHGLAGHQVIPASTRAAADQTESFTLAPAFVGNHRFQGTVYLNKLTGVQWVELNELTYADGTHWRESPDATCRVAPNGLMLVRTGR